MSESAPVDREGPEPIYREVARVLGERIDAGTYQVNRRIPSESQLCDEFDVSRNTVRAAIKVLVDAGRVRPVKGRGVFVLGREGD